MRNRLLFILATLAFAFTFAGLNAQKRFDSKKLYSVSLRGLMHRNVSTVRNCIQ